MTQAKLRELLNYDPLTGVFTWRETANNRLRPGDVAGSVRKSGYVNLGVGGKLYLAHRLAWLYVYGAWPSKELDHINENKSDNRIANLRDVNRSQNCQNIRLPKRNTSGVKGVYFDKRASLWHARVYHDGRHHCAGFHARLRDAAAAYAALAAKVHTHNPMALTS
ncbi:hypothetical protein RF819_02655 [Rhodoferax fermentans]|uniref:HNH nuclease domain-containing protein n=2 Tax=Rhodoferax fermentans TaxID=28066 RepID=A0A1T1AXK6_RHOFE|nr:hypothetical protein RF819_02655 [Rhodoferax fermentans]